MKFYTTDAQINEAIESIKRRSKTLRNDYHRTACSIFRRWNETGDHRPAIPQLNALHDAMGGAVRTNAFKDWVLSCGSVSWDADEKEFVKTANKVSEQSVRDLIDVPFWEYSKEAEYKPILWLDCMKSLVKRARKDIEKLHDKSDVNIKELQAVEAMISAHGES